MTMGTASTMTALAETLGFSLPGASSIPASDSHHMRMATQSGRPIVENAWRDWKPSDFITAESFDNAIAVDMAIGGSTNAIVHLDRDGRARWDRAAAGEVRRDLAAQSRCWPTCGRRGRTSWRIFISRAACARCLNAMGDHLHRGCLTVNGKTLGENIEGAEVYNEKVIRTRGRTPAAAPRCCAATSARTGR